MLALNLADDGRYLSACDASIWCPPGTPTVESLPTGETEEEKDPNNWRYVGEAWIFDPLPQPEPPAPNPDVWDELDAAYQAGYSEGYAEGVNSAYDE